MSDVLIRGPVGMRKFQLDKACDSNQGHEHNYDHVTLVLKGRVKVEYSWTENGKLIEGESREFSAGEDIIIKAKVRHNIIALEDGVLYTCIFSHRDFDGVVCQTYTGNQAAYV